jgi:xeroderma pigmentosum group C-complementing protein
MEVEQTARETGEKPMQGLYSRAQTQWIIPPPIENGIIPKNAYGNIDIYVPSMIPAGAAHVPMRGTVRVCKKLGIDYAEACTGFEFGHQMAVPIIEGVVVAEENAEMLVDAWKEEDVRKRKKEAEKKAKEAANAKKKVVTEKQIKERLDAEYGNHMELVVQCEDSERFQQTLGLGESSAKENTDDDQEEFGGGFVLEDEELQSTHVDEQHSESDKRATRQIAPRSLRTSHGRKGVRQANGYRSDDNLDTDKEDGEEHDAEEFANSVSRRKGTSKQKPKAGVPCASRAAAQTSPYFRQRK